MKYGKLQLNIIQEDRVINAFFDDAFSADGVGAELESFIAKKMEDYDGEFLHCDEEDVENHIKYHQEAIKALEKLREEVRNG